MTAHDRTCTPLFDATHIYTPRRRRAHAHPSSPPHTRLACGPWPLAPLTLCGECPPQVPRHVPRLLQTFEDHMPRRRCYLGQLPPHRRQVPRLCHPWWDRTQLGTARHTHAPTPARHTHAPTPARHTHAPTPARHAHAPTAARHLHATCMPPLARLHAAKRHAARPPSLAAHLALPPTSQVGAGFSGELDMAIHYTHSAVLDPPPPPPNIGALDQLGAFPLEDDCKVRSVRTASRGTCGAVGRPRTSARAANARPCCQHAGRACALARRAGRVRSECMATFAWVRVCSLAT
jgi:hypothetical protein